MSEPKKVNRTDTEWADLLAKKEHELRELIVDAVQNGRSDQESAEPADFLLLETFCANVAFHFLHFAHDFQLDRKRLTGDLKSVERIKMPRNVRGGVVNL